MYLTRKHMSRRTVLKGIGGAVTLPFLDSMTAALSAARSRSPSKIRLVCIENVHGAAGSSPYGVQANLWAPARTGRDFDLGPTSLRSLEPFRDHLTIVSNTDVPSANATEAREIGGDHFRSSAVFLTQSHPKRTDGADVEAGTSLDQIHARRFGQDTAIPSLQLCIEKGDQGGGCQYGYSCTYVDTISWASPTRPLPMIRNPRIVFDELFGVFGSGSPGDERHRGRATDRSLLDGLISAIRRLEKEVGPSDRARLNDYLENVREVERRIQLVEARNGSGEPRDLPAAPRGVPDSFDEHVKLMFDLQTLAFSSDITRVVAFKLGRDGSNRVYPESGYRGAFHAVSHHGNDEQRIRELAQINSYHVSLLPYFLQALRNTPDEDGKTLLDNTLVLYGSPMGDPNLHNHKRVPFFLAGCAGGRLPGGLHLKAPNGTPLADVMLSVLHTLGHEDLDQFGDNEGLFNLG